MVLLRKTVRIDASPAAVWAVLGDLAATSDWLPGTVHARVEGALRTCTTADGDEIREEISDYSSETRTYRYRHLRLPLPVATSTGVFVVEDGSDGDSTVVLEASFVALEPAAEPELERMFGGALEQALESLRRRVETGLPWQAPGAGASGRSVRRASP
jgi:uncharacterized protein YndB with AHSA1/START domain